MDTEVPAVRDLDEDEIRKFEDHLLDQIFWNDSRMRAAGNPMGSHAQWLQYREGDAMAICLHTFKDYLNSCELPDLSHPIQFHPSPRTEAFRHHWIDQGKADIEFEEAQDKAWEPFKGMKVVSVKILEDGEPEDPNATVIKIPGLFRLNYKIFKADD